MEFGALTRENTATDMCESALVAVDVRELDAAGLDSRLRDLGRVQSRVCHPNFALGAALEARDGGCIGCRVEPEWCISHHIIEWQHGGPTQPDNLVLLCHSCHDKVHHNNWAVEKHPDTGRRYLRPPWQKPPTPPPDPIPRR